jgi:hypothetical protein
VSTIGSGFASFLLGLATSGNQEHTFSASSASSYYGLYLQDTDAERCERKALCGHIGSGPRCVTSVLHRLRPKAGCAPFRPLADCI